jgi:hypothetical protein
LKRERWGSLLVQEKYREEMARDRRHPYRIIIIIIIIIIMALRHFSTENSFLQKSVNSKEMMSGLEQARKQTNNNIKAPNLD